MIDHHPSEEPSKTYGKTNVFDDAPSGGTGGTGYGMSRFSADRKMMLNGRGPVAATAIGHGHGAATDNIYIYISVCVYIERETNEFILECLVYECI